MTRMAFAALVILAILCLTVNLCLRGGRPHGALHALNLSFPKAFAAGILAD